MPAKSRRKEPFICGCCLVRPVRPHSYRCEVCANNDSVYRKRTYWGRVAQGLCVTCGDAEARAGKRSCQACAEAMSGRLLARYTRLKAAGRCTVCARHPAWHEHVYCLKCWRKRAKRSAQENAL